MRAPNPFTPDLKEENSSMSDLLGGGVGHLPNGRAINGAKRDGPVPVPAAMSQSVPPSGMRTPRDIMRAREAKQEQRRLQIEQEQRRKSAERRAAALSSTATATGVAGNQHQVNTNTNQQQQQQQQQQQSHYSQPADVSRTWAGTTAASDARNASGAQNASSTERRGHTVSTQAATDQHRRSVSAQQPSSGATAPANTTTSRPRGTSVSQGQPRVPSSQPVAASTSRRSQPAHPPQAQSQSQQKRYATTATENLPDQRHQQQSQQSQQPQQRRQSSGAALAERQNRNSAVSAFPHAFERWETLSSHWEGLTSYWIRRLEQNTEEVRREPLAQQMSRQITDLSAAGANLFHAVVELQRLRASSERKFQRWFYETRAEQERAQEVKAELEKAVRVEHERRTESGQVVERANRERQTAEKLVVEMRRELQISKEEARRAWEELGRREQEERDRTTSLREGRTTIVGGVQVVPMQGGGGGGGGSSRYHGASQVEGHQQNQQDRAYLQYDGQQFPTGDANYHSSSHGQENLVNDTRSASAAAAIPSSSSSSPAYPNKSAATASHSVNANTTISSSSQPSGSTTATSSAPPAPFYRHTDTLLHENPPRGPDPGRSSSSPSQQYHQRYQYAAATDQDTVSNIASASEGPFSDDDEMGGEEGVDNRVQRSRRGSNAVRSEGDSDDYDVGEDLRREQELARRYGVGGPGGGGGRAANGNGASSYDSNHGKTVVSGGSYLNFNPTQQPLPDYIGGSVGAAGGSGGSSAAAVAAADSDANWESLERHRHPTRLSDVLEEDERSRTSPSRASVASRGRAF